MMNNIYTRFVRNNYLSMAVLYIATMCVACNSLIFDDLSDCPQTVEVFFYSQTECEDTKSYVGVTPRLHVMAFNKQGILTAIEVKDNVDINANFSVIFNLPSDDYTFVAWAGIEDALFDVAPLQVGKTTKSDLLLTLKTTRDNVAVDLTGKTVWMGEGDNVVTLPDAAEFGTVNEKVSVNLLEVTNRVVVEVAMDTKNPPKTSPKNFEVAISSANASMSVDGDIIKGSPVVVYPSKTVLVDESLLQCTYTLLDLEPGHNSVIKVVDKSANSDLLENMENTQENFTDLIGTILVKRDLNQPDISLDCQNDFKIHYVIADKCADCYTYYCVSISINDWMIHSYRVDLSDDIY